MRIHAKWLAGAAGVSLALAFAAPLPLHAQANVALMGQVSSQEEGAMEGVLVSARKTGASFTVTVVSDAQGHYAFPVGRLEPGHYTLSIRAAGYELPGPEAVDVTADKAATADIKLVKIVKTKELASHLSNTEWIMSVPGSDKQKMMLTNCVSCHTLERIVRSTHDADEFARDILPRMGSYANQSMPIHPQKRRAERLLEERGDERNQARLAMAKFLSTINLSSSDTWSYPLKTLPRPTGRATHVVITEYDLPRPTAEPHDVIVDQGYAWYSNFGEQTLGRLDPRTGKVTEFQVPVHKQGWPTGMLGLRADQAGHL